MKLHSDNYLTVITIIRFFKQRVIIFYYCLPVIIKQFIKNNLPFFWRDIFLLLNLPLLYQIFYLYQLKK